MSVSVTDHTIEPHDKNGASISQALHWNSKKWVVTG
jgi:hypothetical protein